MDLLNLHSLDLNYTRRITLSNTIPDGAQFMREHTTWDELDSNLERLHQFYLWLNTATHTRPKEHVEIKKMFISSLKELKKSIQKLEDEEEI